MSILLGAIADEFYGATDLANTLVKRGMRTVQMIGVPEPTIGISDADAVVIALKSRTSPVSEAVSDSLAALEWLRGTGARQFFFKYCSTFDSTPEGNIGPVADALMDALQVHSCLVCPAFPTNGRTVYQGHLFVGDKLLSESSMKDHPLTPMNQSDLLRLLEPQSPRRGGLIPWSVVRRGSEAVYRDLKKLQDQGTGYIVVDAITDDDLIAIGHACKNLMLVTGGSGIALGLPDNFRRSGDLEPDQPVALGAHRGRSCVIAGSCSTATRAQIDHVKNIWPCLRVDIDRVARGEPVVEEATQWALSRRERTPVLVYGSADPREVREIQERYGRTESGDMMESTLSGIARKLVDNGFDKMVVAGGETAGAVVTALNIASLRIGGEIDPGVPWTESLSPAMMIALKSGNFGGEDFFVKSLSMLDA